MQKDDREIENYLAGFEPRKLQIQELAPVDSNVWTGRLAAVAVLLIAVGTWVWYARSSNKGEQAKRAAAESAAAAGTTVSQANIILLTQMALENPKRFEEQMDEEARRVLPELRGQQSALKISGRE
jgi:hypothetical protein